MVEGTGDKEEEEAVRGSVSKIITMAFFLSIDLALNSILDYDPFNDQYNNHAKATHLLLGLLGLQIVIQISAFLVLFLAMSDTFLFRVGLLGLLIKKFRVVLILHPIYVALTLAQGFYRVKQLSEGKTLAYLWMNSTYIVLSYLQKIGTLTLIITPPFTSYHSRFICPYTHIFFLILLPPPLPPSHSVAIPYYTFNLRAAIKLGDPIYFTKTEWIALIRQVRKKKIFFIRNI